MTVDCTTQHGFSLSALVQMIIGKHGYGNILAYIHVFCFRITFPLKHHISWPKNNVLYAVLSFWHINRTSPELVDSVWWYQKSDVMIVHSIGATYRSLQLVIWIVEKIRQINRVTFWLATHNHALLHRCILGKRCISLNQRLGFISAPHFLESNVHIHIYR